MLMMDGVGQADRNGTVTLPLGEPHGDPGAAEAGEQAEVEAVSEGGPEGLEALPLGRNRLPEQARGYPTGTADAQEIERGLRLLLRPENDYHYELRAVRVPNGTGNTYTFSKTYRSATHL